LKPLTQSLLIFLGAGLGGNFRYWIGNFLSSKFDSFFPIGTFVINITGSVLIGIAVCLIAKSTDPIMARSFFIIGVLGGYTTFSTFSLDAVTLFQSHNYTAAIGYVIGSVLLSLAGTALGIVLCNQFAK